MKKITRTSPRRTDLRTNPALVKFFRAHGIEACVMANAQFGMSLQQIVRSLAPLFPNKVRQSKSYYVPATRPTEDCPKQMCFDHYFDMRAVTIKLGVAGGVKESTVKDWIRQWQHGLSQRP